MVCQERRTQLAEHLWLACVLAKHWAAQFKRRRYGVGMLRHRPFTARPSNVFSPCFSDRPPCLTEDRVSPATAQWRRARIMGTPVCRLNRFSMTRATLRCAGVFVLRQSLKPDRSMRCPRLRRSDVTSVD